MLRVVVLGNSDTSGAYLSQGAIAWPEQVGRALGEELGTDVSVTQVMFVPRPGAEDYAERKVRGLDADLVVMALSGHWFIRTTGSWVEDRFGSRWAGQYHAAMRRARGLLKPLGPAGTSLYARLRRQVYRAGAAAIYAGSGNPVTHYRDVLRMLARLESVHVVVLGCSLYGREIQRHSPGLVPVLVDLNQQMQEECHRSRLAWVDFDALFGDGPEREACYMHDGIHKTPLGHERIRDGVLEVVRRLPDLRALAVSA